LRPGAREQLRRSCTFVDIVMVPPLPLGTDDGEREWEVVRSKDERTMEVVKGGNVVDRKAGIG